MNQNEIIRNLVSLIDAGRSKAPSAHRDQARRRIRQIIENERWKTPFVSHNLGRARLAWLTNQGYGDALRWLRKETDYNIEKWHKELRVRQ